MTWNPRKQHRSEVLRKCFVPVDTMLLLEKYKGNQAENARLFPHKDTTMNSLLSKLFQKKGIAVTSHDFRHTKLTDLGKDLSP